MKSKEAGVEVLDLVKGLRDAIESSQEALKERGQDAMFQIDKVEAEIHFVVEKTAGAGGGFNIHFVTIGAKGSYKKENVHTLKLTLSPVGGSVEAAGPESGPPP